MAELLIKLAGIHALGFAVFHVFFWRIFNWRAELSRVHFSTRAIIQILNLRLIYIALFVGVLCLFFTKDLLQTNIGRFVLAAFALFWLGRLIEQFIFLRVNDWRVHLLSLLFLIGFLLFGIPLFLGTVE